MTADNGTAAPGLTFEASLARLEQIVREMEDAALPLQRMLALFEEGTLLGKHCQELLDQAELRVTQVMQDGDGAVSVRYLDGIAAVDRADPAF